MRFQNINLDKDGKLVIGTADLKNELKIVMLPNDVFKL